MTTSQTASGGAAMSMFAFTSDTARTLPVERRRQPPGRAAGASAWGLRVAGTAVTAAATAAEERAVAERLGDLVGADPELLGERLGELGPALGVFGLVLGAQLLEAGGHLGFGDAELL